MNSFDLMAQAQLQAAEGQRQLATALARWVGARTTRLLTTLGRHVPPTKTSR
ncbi:MAG: hypothetical protein M3N26_05925 [Pseudomonadota bacterium]|nr:hypothetical protein [Pseudomonadota bacterium]